jgi:hypothetical protein
MAGAWFHVKRAVGQAEVIRMRYVPHWLVVLLVVVVVVIVLALLVAALGGFNGSVQIGHFHLDIGVSKALAELRGAVFAVTGGA